METERPVRQPNMMENISNLLIIVIVVGAIIIAWPLLWPIFAARFGVSPAAPGTAPAPTAAIRIPQPGGGTIIEPRREPAAVTPIPGLAGNDATATAQYNQAVQQSQNGAVVLPANDHAPVQLIQQPAERMAAGDNVPTAGPVDAGAPAVNVQQTQTCLHGQVWTEAGCKNPDSKGSKARP